LTSATNFYKYAAKRTAAEAVKDTSAAPTIIHSVSIFVGSSSTKHTAAIKTQPDENCSKC
jgi:hypothetical protein